MNVRHSDKILQSGVVTSVIFGSYLHGLNRQNYSNAVIRHTQPIKSLLSTGVNFSSDEHLKTFQL